MRVMGYGWRQQKSYGGYRETRAAYRRARAGLQPSGQTLSGDAVLDALNMILVARQWPRCLQSVTRLIETQRPGMLCSIFILDEDGVHLRYAAARSLPPARTALCRRVESLFLRADAKCTKVLVSRR
jgi:hypothetical protein